MRYFVVHPVEPAPDLLRERGGRVHIPAVALEPNVLAIKFAEPL